MTKTVAVLSVAAAVAALMGFPAALRAPFGFALCLVIPGWLVARQLLPASASPPEERALGALVLSAPVCIAARLIGFLFDAPGAVFVAAWGVVCFLGSLMPAPRPHPAHGERSHHAAPIVWGVAIVMGIAVALPAVVNLRTRVFADTMVHAQFVYELLLRGAPPQDPSYAGMPLMYMWPYHVWITATVEATGLSPYEVFPWVSGTMMAALVFAAHRVACALGYGGLGRSLGPAVVVLGMNALGWLRTTALLLLTPWLGEHRGWAVLQKELRRLVLEPDANAATASLIHNSYFVLASLLYKYLSVTSLSTSLSLGVAAVAFALSYIREPGWGRIIGAGCAAAGAAVIHPLVGVSAMAALLVGLAWSARVTRDRALQAGAAILCGLAVAVPVIMFMFRVGLHGGERAHFGLMRGNAVALVQVLAVVALPAIWGGSQLWRRAPALARVAVGLALAAVGMALVVDLPYVGESYLVYVAYLAVALLAADGVAMGLGWLRDRIGAPAAWTLAALVFLPSTLLVLNGFARQTAAGGLAGYPETADERLVFEYLRDRTPVDALVVDTQSFFSSSVAAFAGRRGLFGASEQARIVGYPEAEMSRRLRTVRNLLFEPGISDTTFETLVSVGAPVYTIARRRTPVGHDADLPPVEGVDVIAKLDSFPADFTPLARTSTIVLYHCTRCERLLDARR